MNRNERTPRTLAETTFHTGYREAVMRNGASADRVIYAIVFVVLCAWAVASWLGVSL